jgi:hypothetical protein
MASDKDCFISFDDFIENTLNTEPHEVMSLRESRVRDLREFAAMRAHVLTLYEGVTPSNSFVDDESQYWDCIPIDRQPSLRSESLRGHQVQMDAPILETPEHEADKNVTANDEDNIVGLQLQPNTMDRFGNAKYCREGFIPMRRITLKEVARFSSLQDFFSKGPDRRGHLPELNEATHKYAYGNQTVNNYGGASWLNLWNPNLGSQVFSLSQQWYTGGIDSKTQTIEGGWQVFPQKYGTLKAVLFIYYTPDNYSSGCYNLDSSGFIQVNNTFTLGGTWANYSTKGGTQYGFKMQWKRDSRNGNWWLFLAGSGEYVAVGYYPKSLYGTGQLSSNATRIVYGGETVGTGTLPEMGSGEFANKGWQQAAYQRTIFYIDTNSTSQWSQLTAQEPSNKCYTIDLGSSGGAWGKYFYFGGPGGNNC